jgi:polyhydroxyalkanoate synthesis repressor PhaR
MLGCRSVTRRTQSKAQAAPKRRGPGRPPRHETGDADARFPNARVIKRYGNRRLYDGKLSRCVTMEEIAECVRKGEDVRVVDGDSGEDLTKRVLTQIILEQGNAKVLELLPVEFLRRLILVRSDAASEWIGQYLTLGAQFLEKQMSVSGPASKVVSESLNTMFPWMQQWMPFEADAPPRDGEQAAHEDALRSQIEEMQRRIADLSARVARPTRR